MRPPTCDEIFNNELREPVLRADDATWRHGCYRTEVYYRYTDGTHWRATYRVSTDGETNELREGLARMVRVYPHEVMTTVYREDPPK